MFVLNVCKQVYLAYLHIWVKVCLLSNLKMIQKINNAIHIALYMLGQTAL
jgi:hypothetical protein